MGNYYECIGHLFIQCQPQSPNLKPSAKTETSKQAFIRFQIIKSNHHPKEKEVKQSVSLWKIAARGRSNGRRHRHKLGARTNSNVHHLTPQHIFQRYGSCPQKCAFCCFSFQMAGIDELDEARLRCAFCWNLFFIAAPKDPVTVISFVYNHFSSSSLSN